MKKMKMYWIVGSVCVGVIVFLSIIFAIGMLSLAANTPNMDPDKIKLMVIPSVTLYFLLVFAAGIVQLVFAIKHLLDYSRDDIYDTSLLSSCLFQAFFGLGGIGLIIVLVIGKDRY
jgi:hypothetical protein